MNVELVASRASSQDFSQRFDPRDSATDDHYRGRTFAFGKLVESVRNADSVIDKTQCQSVFVCTFDIKGGSLAASSDQAGVIR